MGAENAAGDREPFRIAARLRSFRFAFRGIAGLVAREHNAWIHAAASTAVLVLGLLLRISALEWAALVLAATLVWASEALNTALEALGDAACPEHHPLVGRAKDLAAGAVLISALGSVVVGLLVLGPPLLAWLR